MVSLLVTVLVFGLICYIAFWAMSYLNVPEPIRKVVTVIIVVVAVIWLLQNFMPMHWR